MIDKVKMIHIAVTHIDKSKTFYTEKLGLVTTADQAYGDQRWISLSLPNGDAFINLTTVHENMQPGTIKLYLSSTDVESTYKELISKGVKPARELIADWGMWEGSKDSTGDMWFELHDPDGNRLLVIPA